MRINKLLFPILFLALQGVPTYAQNVAGMLKKNNSASQRWANPNQNKNPQKPSLETKPMYGFIENKGQVLNQKGHKNSSVKYLLPLPGNNVILRSTGFSYDTYVTEVKESNEKSTSRRRNSGVSDPRNELMSREILHNYHRVDIEFVNANTQSEIIASEPAEDFINYFLSGDDSEGVTSSHFGKVTYKNIYPMIDVEFIARPGKDKPIEYNFIVHPGGDASLIKMRYRGPKNVNVTSNSIELTLAHGKLIESIPLSYKKQSRQRVKVEYKQVDRRSKDEVTIGFIGEIAKSNETLVIDPTPDLVWGKVYGYYGEDAAFGIVTDSNAKVYVVGNTTATSYIATYGAYQTVNAGSYDAFILKLNTFGVREWCTYFGGTASDSGLSIVADASDIYVLGITSSSGLSSNGAYKNSITGQSDQFIVKFTKLGVPSWCTYYGGADWDTFGKISIDNSGSLCVMNTRLSLSGVYTTNIAKFSPLGNLLWDVSYDNSSGRDITVDRSGNVYVCGGASSTGAIMTNSDSYQQYNGGGSDAFVVKVNSSGEHIFSTFYGGLGNDIGYGIAVDSNDNLYLVGSTFSGSGIASDGTVLHTFLDAFVVKFNIGYDREWGTYFGGNGVDEAFDIAVASDGGVYVFGTTDSFSPAISTSNSYQVSCAGVKDTFLAKYGTDGMLIWATYYGTSNNDYAYECTVDFVGAVYIVGYTSSGIANATIAKFSSEPPCSPPAISSEIVAFPFACAVSFAVSNPTGCKILAADWDFGDGDSSILVTPVHSYGSSGVYSTSVYIIYSCGSCLGDTTLTYELEYNPAEIVFEDTTIEIQTKLKSQVLSSTASTFSDSWVLQHEAEGLSQKSSFVNGSEGVWRNEGTYVFDAQRSASGTVNVATDGTYSLYAFDWRSAEFGMVPSWIKANTMTEYSPFSYELENKDVLGVYSAALYDYGGHLPSANGVNMRNKEMAFTSFEYTSGKTTGNFIFGAESVSASGKFEVLTGYDHVAVVKASMNKIQGIEFVNVMAFTFAEVLPLRKLGRQVFTNNRVICVQEHPTNSEWSILVLQDSPGEFWKGSVYVEGSFLPPDIAVFDTLVAHSGKYSLKIQSTSKTFPQQILELDSAKSYYVSAWVSVNNLQPATPSLADSLGIKVRVKRPNGALVSENFLSASGPIIEGWQQIKGVFNCSINDAVVELKFLPGSGGTAWYDDVRLHPENGNMKSYVYDLNDYRLQAILDEENFASFFYYDAEGNLYLTKKETLLGVKTLTENISYQKH